jgi:hypothetical protein
MPGGANGVRLKSKWPLIWAHADSWGLIHVEHDNSLWDKPIPQVQWKAFVNTAQASNEVVLECANCLLCCIATMHPRWY